MCLNLNTEPNYFLSAMHRTFGAFWSVSLGMLSPFMELLFKGAHAPSGQAAISSNAVVG